MSEGSGWRLISYTAPSRYGQPQATWTTGTSTTDSYVSPAKLKAAILALGHNTVYTGSSVSNVDFPIGTTILVNDATVNARNSLIVPRLDGGDSRDFTTDAGTALTGTWRVRGRAAAGVYVAQRTAA